MLRARDLRSVRRKEEAFERKNVPQMLCMSSVMLCNLSYGKFGARSHGRARQRPRNPIPYVPTLTDIRNSQQAAPGTRRGANPPEVGNVWRATRSHIMCGAWAVSCMRATTNTQQGTSVISETSDSTEESHQVLPPSHDSKEEHE